VDISSREELLNRDEAIPQQRLVGFPAVANPTHPSLLEAPTPPFILLGEDVVVATPPFASL